VIYAGYIVAEMDGRTASEREVTTAMLGGVSTALRDVKELVP